MWPFRDDKSAVPSFSAENTIGTGSRVHGDLSGHGGFRIDGAIEGAIDADGPVVVGEGGLVDGSIQGRDVIVLGRVRGDVRATGHLEIGPKGKILGDITAKSFRMHTGGVFRGMSCMSDGEDVVPALGEGEGASAQRGRTLPPPNGAVPPPPILAELVDIVQIRHGDEQPSSHERLLTTEAVERPRATGT